jgi:hypothetical protein
MTEAPPNFSGAFQYAKVHGGSDCRRRWAAVNALAILAKLSMAAVFLATPDVGLRVGLRYTARIGARPGIRKVAWTVLYVSVRHEAFGVGQNDHWRRHRGFHLLSRERAI